MSKNKKATPESTEKARRAALAELRERSARLDAQEAKASPTTPAGAPGGELGAVAGSPVPPKAKGAKGAKAKAPKAAKTPKPAKEKKPKRVSGLDAAAMVLASAKAPMNCKQIFAEIQSRKLWTTKGATPESTIYAAMLREERAKGKASRFIKSDRGLFTAGAKA
jgi:hypothetical protein